MKKLLKIGLFGLAVGAGAYLCKCFLDTAEDVDDTDDDTSVSETDDDVVEEALKKKDATDTSADCTDIEQEVKDSEVAEAMKEKDEADTSSDGEDINKESE